MSWECVSYWIEHHPGLASWVQAVGSIGAILAAIWIARASERVRTKSEKQKAAALHASVVELCREALTALDCVYKDLNTKHQNSQKVVTELHGVALVLLESLSQFQPLQLSNSAAIVPFYKLKISIENSMSYVQRVMAGEFYDTLFLEAYLPGMLECARNEPDEFSQKG